MRELILTMSMSLDGFVAGTDGQIDWIFDGDKEAIAWKIATIASASLHIMGSTTFVSMASFWPTATTPFAPPMNTIPKAVFSQQGKAILPTAPLPDHAQPGADSWAAAQVATGHLADEITRLKAHGDGPMVAHGGASFARSLVAHDLVDEYRLLIHPVLLGKGLPIFSEVTPLRRLRRIDGKAFPLGTLGQVYRRN